MSMALKFRPGSEDVSKLDELASMRSRRKGPPNRVSIGDKKVAPYYDAKTLDLNMPQGSTRARSERTHRAKRIWSSASTVKTDWTFHQLAPYIGRMKTSMARSLVLRNSQAGDLVVDPFCGSGVVALEAAAHGRQVVVGDWNPYAVLLTRAKLFAPATQVSC
jgi:adenine-specific DNA methylase